MEGVLVVLIVFSVPLTAIIGWTMVRLRKAGYDPETIKKLVARVENLEATNNDMRRRLETLETIVTDPTYDAAKELDRFALPQPAVDEADVEREVSAIARG